MKEDTHMLAQHMLVEIDDAVKGYRFFLAASIAPLVLIFARLSLTGTEAHWLIKLSFSITSLSFLYASIATLFLLWQSMAIKTKILEQRRILNVNAELEDSKVARIIKKHWGHKKINRATKKMFWSLVVGYGTLIVIIAVLIWMPTPSAL